MNIDLSQFDNLELENIGEWPKIAKITLCIFLAVAMLILGYTFFITDRIKLLEKATGEEQTLRQSFKTKYHVTANLDLFKEQMANAEALFAKQLKSLPNSHETPGLLDDITFVGTTSGLSFVTLNWQPEVSREIYIELPIDIEVIGSYHQFGRFVSKVAGLPRIVTLHDFDISKISNSESLRFKLKAKTYRYRGAKKE